MKTKRRAGKKAQSARPARRREGLRGSMSSDPQVIAGERDRDAIPHTGREGFGEGQELSHSKKSRR